VASSTATARSRRATGKRGGATTRGGRDEGLGGELPQLCDAWIELTRDEIRPVALRQRHAAARMQTRRVPSLTRGVDVEQILETRDDPLQIANVEAALGCEPRLAVLHRLRIPGEQDADGPSLLR